MSRLLNRSSLYNKIIRNHLLFSRIQTYSEKVLSTDVLSEPKEVPDILSYVDRSKEFKTGISSTISKLETLFCITKKKAVYITANNKFLREVPGKVISDNYKLCQENGISNETILICLFILAERCLFEKIYLLQKVNYDLNVLAPLLKLNVLSINAVVTYGDLLGRISFFSTTLEVSEFEVCKLLVKRQFLLSLNLERTKTICKLLFENGISKKEILKDLWVLRYSNQIIEERIEYAKSQKVEKLKTWMVRGTFDIFDKYIQRKSDYKSVLGDKSLAEYLSKELNCSIDPAKDLVMKYPALEKKNLKKVEEIIKFLYEKGFTSDDIFRNPKILFFTVDTIEKRLNQVEKHKWRSVGLHVFVKSQKQFNEYCEALLKSEEHKKKAGVITN